MFRVCGLEGRGTSAQVTEDERRALLGRRLYRQHGPVQRLKGVPHRFRSQQQKGTGELEQETEYHKPLGHGAAVLAEGPGQAEQDYEAEDCLPCHCQSSPQVGSR